MSVQIKLLQSVGVVNITMIYNYYFKNSEQKLTSNRRDIV